MYVNTRLCVPAAWAPLAHVFYPALLLWARPAAAAVSPERPGDHRADVSVHSAPACVHPAVCTHTNTCRASRLSFTRYLTVHICSIHSPGVLHFQGLIVGLVVLTAHSLINKHLLELHIRAGESHRAAQEDCGFPSSSYQLQVWEEGRWQP